MQRKRRIIVFSLVSFILIIFNGIATASQFTINNSDIEDGTTTHTGTYIGSNPLYGHVLDGGYDAFDTIGRLYDWGGLTVQRQVETLTTINTYRWLDTFTNNTGNTITQTVRFYGNLGSDHWTFTDYSDPFYTVSHQDTYNSDPAIALVNGNNSWTSSNITTSITGDNYDQYISITLGAGESLSILNYAFLARENTDYYTQSDVNADIALARSTGQNLINNPYVAGLTQAQIDNIVNFDMGQPSSTIPEPTTMVLFGFGLLGMAGVSRRKRRV